MGVQQIVPPASYPIALNGDAGAKRWCRIPDSDTSWDDWFTAAIAVATDYVETYTQRQLITATWLQTFSKHEQLNARALRLYRPPLQSVTSVTWVDFAGNVTTWDPSLYRVRTMEEPAQIVPNYQQVWPDAFGLDAYTVTYTAGFGAASSVPPALIQAIRMLIAHWFQNAEAVTSPQPFQFQTLTTMEVPLGVQALCSLWRIEEMK